MARLTTNDTVANESARSKQAARFDDNRVIETEIGAKIEPKIEPKIEITKQASVKNRNNKLKRFVGKQVEYPLVLPF